MVENNANFISRTVDIITITVVIINIVIHVLTRTMDHIIMIHISLVTIISNPNYVINTITIPT